MSEVMHLRLSMRGGMHSWCIDQPSQSTGDIAKATCLTCLLACAEYGSEARHRYEVCRENGARP